MIDNIEPSTFLIAMITIFVVLLVVATLDQMRLDRNRRALDTADQRLMPLIYKGACAHTWHEHRDIHVCTRPYEHEGPHFDSEHEALLR
ncbi:hypothetical protein ACTU6V_05350 [Microbacterium sp. A204]|uniref:hypothetical protein n=1 Tax=Microbacterium sp. A204 TaxID=3457321 RepID=UPI003FD08FA4